MNDTRRGRGRGRSRGGGGGGRHQQPHRTEESSWTVVKPSPDHHNSAEIHDVSRRPFRVESNYQKPSSSKQSSRGTDGGRRGNPPRNRNRGKEVSDSVVGDGAVRGEVEGVEIEVGRRGEEGVDVDVDGGVAEVEDKVGEEACDGCELGKDEDLILRRLEELRLAC